MPLLRQAGQCRNPTEEIRMTFRTHKVCTTRYGDRLVPGIEVKCHKCGTTAQKPRGSNKGHSESDKVEARRHTAQFERDGWQIGTRPQEDRCPRCRSAEAKERTKFHHPETNAMTEPLAHHADAPKPMSPADGRIVFDKLAEVYDADHAGYVTGWTDQKVATDLGCPRAWVEQVRKSFYGPEGGNPEINAAVTEAKGFLTDARALADKFSSAKNRLAELITEAQKLNSRGELIERRLASVEKALR